MPSGLPDSVAAAPDVVLARSFFDRPAEEVAPDLLGRVIEHETVTGLVAVRLTEVEAYAGTADAASHAYRGQTPRNAVMFGAAGHVYVYFTYGMHFCMNLVCQREGTASAVLLRAGRVIEGAALARVDRHSLAERKLASGPARLCTSLAVGRALGGADVCDPSGPLRVRTGDPALPRAIRSGPRTGVRGAADVPWRFWIAGDQTVSPYRPHVPRRRAAAGQAGAGRATA
jgi:DNA-3-methyladenine glycosylase